MQINASTPSLEFNPAARQPAEKPVETKEVKTKIETTGKPEDKAENLKKLQDILAENNITLKFRQDTETKALVVELVDDKTGEAIRQIPSEISLKLAAVYVKMQGQFIDHTE